MPEDVAAKARRSVERMIAIGSPGSGNDSRLHRSGGGVGLGNRSPTKCAR